MNRIRRGRMRLRCGIELSCLLAVVLLGCGQGGGKGPSSPGADGGGSANDSTTSDGASQGGSSDSGSGGSAGAPAQECGSGVAEDGFVDVPASDPGIRYVGRFDFADPEAPVMTFPASSVETTFEGDAIDLRLEEGASGATPTSTQYYEVFVDDQAPIKLETCPTQKVYPLARNLASGSHQVRVWKRTEGSVGSATFVGFRVREDTALALPEVPERRIEVVGDSITCGYGNEVSTTDPGSFPFTSTNENATLAYGAVAARALHADYVAVAASGRGMVRNYAGGAGMLAPEFYERTGPDAFGAEWDHSLYTPDVIVINLGTNDFSTGLDEDGVTQMREDYRAAYSDFLAHLRDLHEDATLIAAVGPMMSDSYPPGYQAWTSIRADVQQVVDGFVQGGDSKVLYFEFATQSSPYGEDWHPTVATHQRMADSLSAFIEERLGW